MSSACHPEPPPSRPHDLIPAEKHRPRRWTPGKDGMGLSGSPCLAQRLPANQGAPEREERLVDVGPLVVTDAQASELIEPRKRPLHDPPPATTPLRSTTHRDPRAAMARPQPPAHP